jgi:N-methylhydantoinase A
MMESGPVGGIMAAAIVGAALGMPNVISFDMGGTTAKASVIVDGEITVTAEYEVGGATHAKRWTNGTGHPIRVPVIDLAEVSSGGGSIAWIDPGGALKVGPRSAGAVPGPVAYGKGGTLPTVTDANVVLGYLNPDFLLDGALPIHREAAEAAVMEYIGRPLGLTAIEAAGRIIDVVNANMAEALNIVSVERGHDPREFVMIAFGGAGPVHAMALARDLAIPRVIIPPGPGAFSALGLVASDLKRDYSRTFYTDLSAIDLGRFAQSIAAMEAEGSAMLDGANVRQADRSLKRFADVRYRRQAYELTVPVADGPITPATLTALAASFHQKHLRTYGHANDREPVQVVNLRLTAIGRRPMLTLRQPAATGSGESSVREVWFNGPPPGPGLMPTQVVRRDKLAPQARVVGPAIIESLDSTVVVPPGWDVRVNPEGFLIAEEASHGTR